MTSATWPSATAARTALDRSTLLAALAVACAAALSVAVRLPFVSVPLNTDEGGYAYTAHWMMRGLVLYRDLWFDRPQGTFMVYAAIQRLFGESTEGIRLGAGVYNALTVALMAALGTRLFGRRAGIAAALFFAVASASPVIEGFTANGELLMNLPVAGALLLAAYGRWGLAGFVTALAVAVKPTALASLAPPLLALAWLAPPGAAAQPLAGSPEKPAGSQIVARLALLGVGGLIGLAPFVAHGVMTDAAGYWYAVAGFRVEAHSAFSVGHAVVADFFRTAPSVLAALLPLWLLAALALRRRHGLITHQTSVITAVALLAGSIAGAAAGGYWYWHYYVGLLPGTSLLAGAASHLVVPPRCRGIGVLAAATLVAAAFNVRVVGATPGETSFNLYRRPAYLASAEIADYVRSRTAETDTIYGAFAQAELYHLAGRRCAGKQLYWTEINRVPGAFEDLVSALDDPTRRPVYVVEIQHDLETPGRADAFWARIEKLYRQETTIQGFPIFRLRTDLS